MKTILPLLGSLCILGTCKPFGEYPGDQLYAEASARKILGVPLWFTQGRLVENFRQQCVQTVNASNARTRIAEFKTLASAYEILHVYGVGERRVLTLLEVSELQRSYGGSLVNFFAMLHPMSSRVQRFLTRFAFINRPMRPLFNPQDVSYCDQIPTNFSRSAEKKMLDHADMQQTQIVLKFLVDTFQEAYGEDYFGPSDEARQQWRALTDAIHGGPVRRQAGCVPPELRPGFFCDMVSDVLGVHQPSFLGELAEFLLRFFKHCFSTLFGKSALLLYLCVAIFEWAPRILVEDFDGLETLRNIFLVFQRSELRSALFIALLFASWLFGCDGIEVLSGAGLFQLRCFMYVEARRGFPGVLEHVRVRELRWPMLRPFDDLLVFALFFMILCMAVSVQWALLQLAAFLWAAFPLLVSRRLRADLWNFIYPAMLVAHRRLFARIVPRLEHLPTDICGICHDELDLEPLVYCRYGCGRCLHENCQKTWLKTRSHCIFCNARW